ncbi:MAG: hypothetical protein ABGY72_12455 [bacterium]
MRVVGLHCVGVFLVVFVLVRLQASTEAPPSVVPVSAFDPVLVMGVAAAILGSRLIRRTLFGIEPVDPLTYAVVSVLVVIVTTGACLLPARRATRATRVDPVTAFRAE